jgi:HK97 family phage major capsid protein
MNATMKKFHDAAMEAHAKAKAIMTEHKATGIPADKKEEFNSHMADWTQNHQAFLAAKEEAEQFSQLDAANEFYTAPTSPIVSPAQAALESAQTTMERNAAARVAHKDAFRRFLAFGPSQGLSQAEQVAYVAGPSQLLGNNPHEALMGMLPQEQHALVGNVDSLGGFLVPDEFMDELIKELAGFSVVRPLAKVKRTSRSSATFLTVQGSGNAAYSSGLTGSFRSEGWVVGGTAPPTQNQPRFGRERVPVHIWAPDIIELTMELLEDSAVNLDAEIRGLLSETRALDEDSAFLNGTGVGMPMGILQEVALGNITTVQSGVANGQTYAGLVNLFTALPAQYRGRADWVMNSVTLGLIMALEDTGNTLIFPHNEVPTSLFNRPLHISEFLPDGDTDGNDAILFGDWSFYGVADRADMRIIRLTERFAPNIGILAVARVGGQVLKTAAFRAQNVGV